MKLASIETIKTVEQHSNADALDIVTVLGYRCIVGRGAFSQGDKVVLIQPDTVLPDEPWAEMFRKRSNRVKACRLRGEWSYSIVLPLSILQNYGELIE
jgi:RNA ligase (TIGR02306 family)